MSLLDYYFVPVRTYRMIVIEKLRTQKGQRTIFINLSLETKFYLSSPRIYKKKLIDSIE